MFINDNLNTILHASEAHRRREMELQAWLDARQEKILAAAGQATAAANEMLWNLPPLPRSLEVQDLPDFTPPPPPSLMMPCLLLPAPSATGNRLAAAVAAPEVEFPGLPVPPDGQRWRRHLKVCKCRSSQLSVMTRTSGGKRGWTRSRWLDLVVMSMKFSNQTLSLQRIWRPCWWRRRRMGWRRRVKMSPSSLPWKALLPHPGEKALAPRKPQRKNTRSICHDFILGT